MTLISNYSFPPIALLEEYGSELIYIEEELDEGVGCEIQFRQRQEYETVGTSFRMDETYIKVKGKLKYTQVQRRPEVN